jgi:hypothetical protein
LISHWAPSFSHYMRTMAKYQRERERERERETQRTVCISFRCIFNSLISFMGIPNSMRILYKKSLLTESLAVLKSTNSWCTASLYSHFSQVFNKCRIYDE